MTSSPGQYKPGPLAGSNFWRQALQLSGQLGRFPIVKRMTAGIVFFGTPHVEHKHESLRKAIWNTVSAYGFDDSTVDDSQVREYATAVGRVNGAFNRLPSRPSMISVWEQQPTEFQGKGGLISELVTHSCPYPGRAYPKD